MYYLPQDVISLLREDCRDYLAILGETPDPSKKRLLVRSMWVLAWNLDDWDSLSYAWQFHLFYSGQVVTMC